MRRASPAKRGESKNSEAGRAQARPTNLVALRRYATAAGGGGSVTSLGAWRQFLFPFTPFPCRHGTIWYIIHLDLFEKVSSSRKVN